MTDETLYDDETELLDAEILNDLLDDADSTGLYEFHMRVEKQSRSEDQGGDVFFVIGNVPYQDEETGELQSTGDERILTVYTSVPPDISEPTYDAEAVANHIVTAVSAFPGLVVQLLDAMERLDELERERSTVSYLAGQAYLQTRKAVDDPSHMKRIWQPVLDIIGANPVDFTSMLGIDTNVLSDEDAEDDESEDTENTSDGQAGS